MESPAVILLDQPRRRRDPDAIVGFISGQTVSLHFMHSLHNVFKTDVRNRFGADWFVAQGPYIHANRNRLQETFETDFAEGREWLFMVDNDLVFAPEDVWRLLDEAERRGPGVYGGPYLMEDSSICAGTWDDEVPYAFHALLRLPERPQEIGVVGAGFCMIHRDVFAAVGPDAFAPVAPGFGEDVSFCWRAREAGYTPMIVPACNPGHHKTVVLFPHDSVRNSVGDEVNLVLLDPAHKALNEREEVTQ